MTMDKIEVNREVAVDGIVEAVDGAMDARVIRSSSMSTSPV